MFTQNGISCSACAFKNGCALRTVGDKALSQIDARKRTRTYSRGETIFHQGDESNYFFCLSSGSVQVFRNSPYREQSFSILGPGDWIGFRDALSGAPYQHNARVLKTATVCKIPAELLSELLVTEPSFAAEMTRELALGWRAAENQSYNLGARNIMERLADFLLSLRENRAPHRAAESERLAGGSDSPENAPEVDLPLTREVIATLLGSSTESIIRALSDFKARGWIDTKKGKVIFCDENALNKILVES